MMHVACDHCGAIDRGLDGQQSECLARGGECPCLADDMIHVYGSGPAPIERRDGGAFLRELQALVSE